MSPIYSEFFTSTLIARYLLFSSLVLTISQHNIRITLGKYQLAILCIFFLSQSLSVINAINIEAFLTLYKEIVFSFIIFFMSIVLITSKEKLRMVINILFLGVLVNVFAQSIIYFELYPFYDIFRNLAKQTYWDGVFIQSQRGRYFIDIFDVCLIPLLGYFAFIQKKNTLKIYYTGIMLGVILFSILSGFRTHILVFIFVIFGTMIFYFTHSREKILLTVSIIIVSFILLFYNIIRSNSIPITSIDRILSPEEGDYTSIESRLWMWGKAYDMATAYPFFGVGLGNYYDHLNLYTSISSSIFDWKNRIRDVTIIDPHNIFFQILSQTGFVGLFSFTLLVTSFIVYDYRTIKQNRSLFTDCLIVSFWSVFVFALFNPAITIQYLSLFWLLRGLIVSLKSNRIKI